MTSLPRASSLGLLRDHQTTPPTITPTTSSTMMIATASRALSQPGIAVLRFGNSATDSHGSTRMENQRPTARQLVLSVHIRVNPWPICLHFKCLSSQPITVLYQKAEFAGFCTQ